MRQEIEAIIEKEVEKRFESRVGKIMIRNTELLATLRGDIIEIKALLQDLCTNLLDKEL